MTIVPLQRVVLYGLVDEKARVLSELQTLGCLHLDRFAPSAGEDGRAERRQGTPAASPQAREALDYLLAGRPRRRQVRHAAAFDPHAVQNRALEIRDRTRTLEDERDALLHRIEALEPWGDFRVPAPEALGGMQLWFYVVPHYRMREVRETNLDWAVVGRDNRASYVVVLAAGEPSGMPVPRVHTGSQPLSELQDRLDAVELEIQDLQAERASLTRWCTLFRQSLDRLDDSAARTRAAGDTLDAAPVFALQGWVPAARADEVRRHAETERLAVTIAPPGPDDDPPTLLANAPPAASGQDLVQFYTIPGYRTWDPSSAVFFSFAVFFAMILSDAGYALLLSLPLMLYWGRMGASDLGRRLRALFASLLGAALAWGVMVGGYFGLDPPPGTLLAGLQILNVNDYEAMMAVSITVGILHLLIANGAIAWQRRSEARGLGALGWVVMLLGGTALWAGYGGAGPDMVFADGLVETGPWLLGAGGLLVLGFTAPHKKPLGRLLGGLLGLTGITSAFGDVLSYLRLFALGLASASLALAFNDLAGTVADALPGLGLFLALLVLLIGHGLNLTLALMSGFVHGLRLNFIEFFRWCVPEEGHPFQAFARKAAPEPGDGRGARL